MSYQSLMVNITVDLVILPCLDFSGFVILGLFTKSSICEQSQIAHDNNFRAILKFPNLSSSRN